MKDLLEISGMMNISYYSSYLLMANIVGQISIWLCIIFLRITGVFTSERFTPYGTLLSCYLVASATFAMAFGFIIPRSEYYGLPVFIATCALTVCGAYLALANNISVGVKLFFCFLSPSVGLTMGVIVTENYLFHHDGNMNYHYINHHKNYPNLNDIQMVILLSALAYFLLTLILPFDWIWKFYYSHFDALAINKHEDVQYPCDAEDEEPLQQSSILLDANSLTQVYPDGTAAVKDMSFTVRKGEE